MISHKSAIEFLSLVYGATFASGLYTSLFAMPGESSLHLRSPEDASPFLEANAEANISCRMSPIKTPPRSGKRGGADLAAGICGLWLDVDFADKAHASQKAYPPDMETAEAILKKAGPPPSLRIHSGHGLHCHWIFREPWLFESDEDSQAAAALVRNWEATVRSAMESDGYTIDSVHNLDRLMRLPGTVNHKADPVPVQILDANDNRYNPDDFEIYLSVYVPEGSNTLQCGHLIIDPNAEPPAGKFSVLFENHDTFRDTWNRKRRDMKDKSPSAYDQALACAAAAAKWTDQEIANLLLAHRRKHNTPVKQHLRYYQLTIDKARKIAPADEAIESLYEASLLLPAGSPAPEDQRARILADISRVIGVQLRRWIQIGRERSIYIAHVDHGGEERNIKIGGVDSVLSQTKFRQRIYEATGHPIPQRKPAEWNMLARLLASISEVTEVVESERGSVISEWLDSYLSSNPPDDSDTWRDAHAADLPFITESKIYISAESLHRHIRHEFEERPSKPDLYEMLSLVGGKSEEITARSSSGRKIHRRRWSLPLSVYSATLEEASL